mgnify:CR=1
MRKVGNQLPLGNFPQFCVFHIHISFCTSTCIAFYVFVVPPHTAFTPTEPDTDNFLIILQHSFIAHAKHHYYYSVMSQ